MCSSYRENIVRYQCQNYIIHLATISNWSQFYHCVKRDFDVGHFLLFYFQKISEETPQHSLVTNYYHVLLPLQLHDDGLHSGHQVLVALTVGIAIQELVPVPTGVFFRVASLDLVISQSVIISSIDLV